MELIKWALLPLLLLGACSEPSGETLENESKRIKLIERISSQSDLSIPSGSRLAEFHEENPEYNPSWVAKIELPDNDSAQGDVKEALSSKSAYDSITVDPLTHAVSWWDPKKSVISIKYMTPKNALVDADLCEEGESLVLFLSWIAP